MQLNRITRAVMTLAVAVPLSVTACSIIPSQDSKISHDVTTHGGTYKFGKMTIKVPSGAVKGNTTLTVKMPTQTKPSDAAPLQGATVTQPIKFDVSLTHGAEPSKPLELDIPLKGAYLPKKAKPNLMLLYTKTSNGFELLPSEVLPGPVLRAELPHLSPKYLVPADSAKLVGGIFPKVPVLGGTPQQCKKQVTLGSVGDVKLAGSNWSDKNTSPVHPCLGAKADQLQVTIENNSFIIWSVAADKGVTLIQGTDDLDSEMIKLLAGKLFPDSRTKAYLARDSNIYATISASITPRTVELKADTNNYLAEIIWRDVVFLTSITEGKSASAVLRDARTIVDTASVITCLSSAIKGVSDDDLLKRIGDAFDIVTSVCGSKIIDALKHVASFPSSLLDLAKYWINVFGALEGYYENMASAIQGAYQRLKGTIQITVSANPCLSRNDFAGTASQLFTQQNHVGGDFAGFAVGDSAPFACYNGWMGAVGTYNFITPGAPQDPIAIVLHFTNNKWTLVGVRTPDKQKELCHGLPKKVAAVFSC